MHILHINGSKAWGGNEQQLVDMVLHLEELGVRNTVFCARKSVLKESLDTHGINNIPAATAKFKSGDTKRQLTQIKKKQNVDLIHLHTSNATAVFIKEDLFSKVKVPAVLSKKGMGSSMSFLSRFKYNYKGIKKIICISEDTKRQMAEKVTFTKNLDRLITIYDGVNVDRMAVNTDDIRDVLSIDSTTRMLANIANHTPAKDIPTLIKSIDYLINTLHFKNIHLVQMGNFTKATPFFKEQISALGLEQYISFMGTVPNASGCLKQFDLHVLSSEREGMGLVHYESFYMKTPVVSTEAGGIPELVKNGINGRTVPIKSPEALAKAIYASLTETAKTEEYVDNAYKLLMDSYTTATTSKQIKSVYESILA